MKNSDITKWQTKVDVSNKILCQDGRLVALESGLYAVYTQLYILAYREEGVDEDRADSFLHGVSPCLSVESCRWKVGGKGGKGGGATDETILDSEGPFIKYVALEGGGGPRRCDSL